MNGMPEMPGQVYGMPKPSAIEGHEHTDDEIIEDGLRKLGNDAISIYTAINSTMPHPASSFAVWIDSFNTLPPEERSRGVYDSGQALTKRRSVSKDVRTPTGHTFTINRDEEGEVTLAVR